MHTRKTGKERESQDRKLIEERNAWFYSLDVKKKEEKLFELEVLLKGLDRFFNLANQPISQKEGIVKRNFIHELRIIRNAVAKVVRLSQGLLTEEDNRILRFRNYVENRLLSDYQRAKIIERSLHQRTPEESLYVLCHSFINFQEILQNVTGQDEAAYFLFYHIEQLISREIAGNRFFNPFKAAGFAPHYDVIKSPRFARVARDIPDHELRRHLSVVFLIMFKLLRYLSFVKPEVKDLEPLKDSLLIFSLMHSESRLLIDFLEKDLPARVRNCSSLPPEVSRKLLGHVDSLAYQLSVELDKMYELELKDAAENMDMTRLRNGISRSRGLFTSIFQQGIIHIAQVFDPELKGKDVFPGFISRLEVSLKLRKDVWLFHKVIENLERVITDCKAKNEVIPIIESIKTLRNFIFYYQNISFQFVRSMDRDEFQRFFTKIDKFNVADLYEEEKLDGFIRDLHAFKMFLETTLASINNRNELQGIPFGTEEGEKILAQFLT